MNSTNFNYINRSKEYTIKKHIEFTLLIKISSTYYKQTDYKCIIILRNSVKKAR